ncbi:MAG: hypothetical protein EOM25_05360 [Deltaproteobacteria bacterium]|nr:hypothetical protein [Deltaproteobacteria bacterium]
MNITLDLWSASLYALAMVFASCVVGLPLTAVGSEAISTFGRKTFADKFGQQTMRFGLVMIVATWVALGTQFGLMARDGVLTHPLLAANRELLLAALSLLALGSVLSALSYLQWKKWKKEARGLHLGVGIAGVLSLALAFLAAGFVLRGLVLFPDRPVLTSLPGQASLFWPLWIQWLALSVALSSGLTLAYLLTRRLRDDFGRDYYRYALRFGARWALWPLLALVPLCSWFFFLARSGVHFTAPDILVAAGSRGLTLAAAVICWLAVARSDSPLRLKWAVVLAAALVFVFVLFTLASFTAMLIQFCPELTGQTFVGIWLAP